MKNKTNPILADYGLLKQSNRKPGSRILGQKEKDNNHAQEKKGGYKCNYLKDNLKENKSVYSRL